jgi:hypothetical protein
MRSHQSLLGQYLQRAYVHPVPKGRLANKLAEEIQAALPAKTHLTKRALW